MRSSELGDVIHSALSQLGITGDRVTRWVGKPCGCEERREKLNSLSRWAKRVVAGKVGHAVAYLEDIIDG